MLFVVLTVSNIVVSYYFSDKTKQGRGFLSALINVINLVALKLMVFEEQENKQKTRNYFKSNKIKEKQKTKQSFGIEPKPPPRLLFPFF